MRFEGFRGSPFGSLFGHFLLFLPASVLFVNGVPVGERVPFWRFWGVRRAWFWASGVDAEIEPTEGVPTRIGKVCESFFTRLNRFLHI